MISNMTAPNQTADAAPSFDLLVARTEGLQPWRRLFHATNGIMLSLAPLWLGLSAATTVALLSAGTLVAFGLDVVRLRVPEVNRRFFSWFRTLASPREAGGIASSSWYALGATLVWLLFDAPIASASIAVLGLADPAASAIGRIWGRRRLGKGSRLGTSVFFAVALLVLVVWAPGPGFGALALVAALVALIEVMPLGLDDNLTIPLATGGLLWLVQRMAG